VDIQRFRELRDLVLGLRRVKPEPHLSASFNIQTSPCRGSARPKSLPLLNDSLVTQVDGFARISRWSTASRNDPYNYVDRLLWMPLEQAREIVGKNAPGQDGFRVVDIDAENPVPKMPSSEDMAGFMPCGTIPFHTFSGHR
jgi:hypothetical protein